MIEKLKQLAKEAVTFAEALAEQRAENAVSLLMDKVHSMVRALREVLENIIKEKDGADRFAAITQAFEDFKAAIDQALPAPETVADLPPASEVPAFMRTMPIAKIDLEQRLVFGIFSVSKQGANLIVDSQDDVIEPSTLEKAAYDFVLTARIASEEHDRMGVGRLVESFALTAEKQEAFNKALEAAGIEGGMAIEAELWWGGFFIEDDEVWEAVKSGDFPAFSIGGEATREPIDIGEGTN